MAAMANPMDALKSYQENASAYSADPAELIDGFLPLHGKKGDGYNMEFVKIVGGVVQALAMFAVVSPVNGLPCFQMAYAVAEKYRRQGLAFKAVTVGIKELRRIVRHQNFESFYLEAVIAKTNSPSIQLAKKVFGGDGLPGLDPESGTPSLFFKTLIESSYA